MKLWEGFTSMDCTPFTCGMQFDWFEGSDHDENPNLHKFGEVDSEMKVGEVDQQQLEQISVSLFSKSGAESEGPSILSLGRDMLSAEEASRYSGRTIKPNDDEVSKFSSIMNAEEASHVRSVHGSSVAEEIGATPSQIQESKDPGSVTSIVAEENPSRDSPPRESQNGAEEDDAPDNMSTPTNNTNAMEETQECDPLICRMTSGICVDCTRCRKHCKCNTSEEQMICAKVQSSSPRSVFQVPQRAPILPPPMVCDPSTCRQLICGDCSRCTVHCACVWENSASSSLETPKKKKGPSIIRRRGRYSGTNRITKAFI